MADIQSTGESATNAVGVSNVNPTISNSHARRRLKVVPKSRHSKASGRSLPCAPTLIFGGRWLQRAGFEVGSHVHIVVSEGRLVIERLPEEGGSEVQQARRALIDKLMKAGADLHLDEGGQSVSVRIPEAWHGRKQVRRCRQPRNGSSART